MGQFYFMGPLSGFIPVVCTSLLPAFRWLRLQFIAKMDGKVKASSPLCDSRKSSQKPMKQLNVHVLLGFICKYDIPHLQSQR